MTNNTNYNRNNNYNNNYNKTNCQADIKRQQALFNRFRRRFNTTTDTQERRWLKTEATRIAQNLRMWSKRWQTWGFGTTTWITRNYTVTNFSGGTTTNNRRTTTRRTTTNRTSRNTNNYTGTYNTNRTPRARRTNRTRTTACRTNFCAW